MVIVSLAPEIAIDETGGYAGGLGISEGDKFLGAYFVIKFIE
ncbi:MAG: hypothetical protein QXL96_04260 [Ignisphaera sp.]